MGLAGLTSATKGDHSLMSGRQELIHAVQSHWFLLEHRAAPLI